MPLLPTGSGRPKIWGDVIKDRELRKYHINKVPTNISNSLKIKRRKSPQKMYLKRTML